MKKRGWYAAASPEVRRAWRRLRAEIVRERGAFCQRCASPAGYRKLHLHHRRPVCDGGMVLAPKTELVLLCWPCHRREHQSPEQQAWTDWLTAEWG